MLRIHAFFSKHGVFFVGRRSRIFKSLAFVSFIILLSLSYQAYRSQALADQRPQSQFFSGHNDHNISLHDASVLTGNFRHATGNNESTVLGEYFDKDALISALNQEHCTGLRIYYGKHENGTPCLILVGVDRTGTDMISGAILDYGIFCPPICGEGNPLTTDQVEISSLNQSHSALQQ